MSEAWRFHLINRDEECELCGKSKVTVAIETHWGTTLFRCFECFGKLVASLTNVNFVSSSGMPIHQVLREEKATETIAEADEVNEETSKKVQAETLRKLGREPTSLKALFSNGEIEKVVYYANAVDIPHSIPCYLKEGYPYRTKTLLLKKVEKVGKFNVEV